MIGKPGRLLGKVEEVSDERETRGSRRVPATLSSRKKNSGTYGHREQNIHHRGGHEEKKTSECNERANSSTRYISRYAGLWREYTPRSSPSCPYATDTCGPPQQKSSTLARLGHTNAFFPFSVGVCSGTPHWHVLSRVECVVDCISIVQNRHKTHAL